jgi:hypothetical protein
MKGRDEKNRNDRRRYPRVIAPVFFREPRVFTKKQRISDLSLGGVRIFSDQRLYIRECLELEFFLPDGSTVAAKAKVVWIKDMPPGSEAVYDVGMEFVELGEDEKEKLKTVLK